MKAETEVPFEPDEWELDSDEVVACELLGQGAFGVVRKGFLLNGMNGKIDVAIKMLKGKIYRTEGNLTYNKLF